ncbi:MAG TPA: LysR substrate-binding domain-containing protein [Steroidobacteraceae bacterium]|nr:LysR substrate-binding domain-containing protein [Steroidobacteraceae bacterium]
MNKLPSLRAIQAFEAIARTGSVTAAAIDLGVSPGAITQQIHALEKHLRFRVVQRTGRGVELTAWGRIYLQRASAAVTQLRKAHEDVERARHSNQLVASALPSLAIGWLGPLMFEWKKLHPSVNVIIEGKDPEPRLDDGEADFRISYGSRYRQHSRYTQLFTDRMLVVASPSLVAAGPRIAKPRDLLKFPLIWTDWGPEYVAPPSWRDWFAAAGVSIDALRSDLTFSLPSGAIYAAEEGRGIAFAQYSMAASALTRGTLVRVLPPELLLPESHFVAWGAAALEKSFGVAFHDWVINVGRRF